MFWDSKLYKTVICAITLLCVMACGNNDEPAAYVDDIKLSAKVDTRADALNMSDFSDLYLFYPTKTGTPEYDSLNITSMLEFSGVYFYFRGALHDLYWSDVKDNPTSQFYLVGKYKGDDVWANAVAGNTTLRSGIYQHSRMEFNTLEYRYSKLTVVVEGKEDNDSLDGSSLVLTLKTYKPTNTNSFLKRQVASSLTAIQTTSAGFDKRDHRFIYIFSSIPEQNLTDATKYLEVRYAGIDYTVDLSSLVVNRSSSYDHEFKYLAGENQTLTIKIQPSVALTTNITVNTSSWDTTESIGSYVADLRE